MRFAILAGVNVAALLTALFMPSGVAAAPQPSQTGIALSPFEEQISIGTSDIEKSFNLTLTNHTSGIQELNLSPRDFGSLNDTGGVFLEGSNNFTQKYGLTSWMTLGTDTVILQPGESQTLPVTISNRPDLQPGGHYGAVVASVTSLADQTGNKVAINQQLVSLVFVDKVGGEKYDLRLTSIRQNGNWFHVPNDVVLRFQNPGNVHVTPRGIAKLKSPSGTVVAQGVINLGSAVILPESYRELPVTLTHIGSALPLPGLYHVEVDYRYDQISQYAVKNYAVPFVDLGLYIVVGLIALIVCWVLWKRYQKRPKKLLQKTKITV